MRFAGSHRLDAGDGAYEMRPKIRVWSQEPPCFSVEELAVSRRRVRAAVLFIVLMAAGLSQGDESLHHGFRLTITPGWKKLGLEQKQLDQMRHVQARYGPRIKALEKELRKLRAEEAAELEKILTPAQRDKLREIQKRAGEEPKK
jgi:hypothetical protein